MAQPLAAYSQGTGTSASAGHADPDHGEPGTGFVRIASAESAYTASTTRIITVRTS